MSRTARAIGTSVVAAAALAVPSGAALARTLLGPPALCHPIDIGNAESLPWGDRPFDADEGYDLARLVPDTLRLLDGTDLTLVHMETIRRAVVYATGIQGNVLERAAGSVTGARDDRVEALVAALRTRARERGVALEGAGLLAGMPLGGEACRQREARQQALAAFDFGYVLAALRQAGFDRGDAWRPLLDRAATLAPDDGAVELGCSIAFFGLDWGKKNREYLPHLRRACELAAKDPGLLRSNLVSTMGGFLHADTYDALVAKVGAKVENA